MYMGGSRAVMEPPSSEELTQDYSIARDEFKKAVTSLVDLHARSRLIPMQGVAELARLMFARVVLLGGNALRLCPEASSEVLWDFTSIALIVRCLFESVMFLRYFIEQASHDEMDTRLCLLYLYDASKRMNLFKQLRIEAEVSAYEGEVKRLRGLLIKKNFFLGLEEKRRKELLNCSRASVLTLREMGDRYAPDESTWVIFEFLSCYTHSHPMSFMRNNEDRRDGLANDLDKMYMPGILRWATSLIEAARNAYGKVRIDMPEPSNGVDSETN
jgi:hypothetical protein